MDTGRHEPFAASLLQLDARLAREIVRLRTRYQLSLDEFRGLYISDEHVDGLLAAHGHSADDDIAPPLLADSLSADPRWTRMRGTFRLSELEQELLIIALAPELDLKYETLYAYLNDDVTRRSPTSDLARRLLAPRATAGDVLSALAPAATLQSRRLIEAVDPPSGRPSLLNGGFTIHASLARYLYGLSLGADLPRHDWTSEPAALDPRTITELRRLGRILAEHAHSPVVILEGPDRTAQRQAAESIADGAGRRLRAVDFTRLRRAGPLAAGFSTLALEADLDGAVTFVSGIEPVLDSDGRVPAEFIGLFEDLSNVPLVLAATAATLWRPIVGDRRARVISLGTPDYAARVELWRAATQRAEVVASDEGLRALADRYIFTTTEIEAAAAMARETRLLAAESASDAAVTLQDAARAVARHRAGPQTTMRSAAFGWNDLVLPTHTLERLKELAAAIRLRHVVFGEWGFGRLSGAGIGVKALFAGPSGTGKTMGAGVIAHELGLETVKVDLAATVSKYIGETEKNLDRAFAAARAAGSLLFFDEADAIFGKRSEVKEAHDRYANIEIAYLLQKLEDHDGPVILATNFRRNIDEAFSRRLNFVVDFPQPDAALRERLWRGMFPSESPLAADVDFAFLAKQFELAGGDIRNVAIDAAFLAADAGMSIGMSHVVRAMKQQLSKQGKATSPATFQRYHVLLGEPKGGSDHACLRDEVQG